MKRRLSKPAAVLVFSILVLGVLMVQLIATASAEDTFDDSVLGFVDEVGTYFEITNSRYLNITLASTEIVHVFLESIPKVVSLSIESDSPATSTDLTFTGFEPDTAYYMYQDGYPVGCLSVDPSGGYTYTQDISEPHHVYIREDSSSSTIYITSDYTFTHDIHETIVVAADNVVIDGNGYGLYAPTPYGDGFYVFNKKDVTIKNVHIEGWMYGIHVRGPTWPPNPIYGGHDIIDNEIVATSLYPWAGIYLVYQTTNTICGNTLLEHSWGIMLMHSTAHVYHNNFVNCMTSAWATGPGSTWDNGYPSGGNYWSEYTGVDEKSGPNQDQPGSDGIGDTPYLSTGVNDRYPLKFFYYSHPEKGMEDIVATIESWGLETPGTEKCLVGKVEAVADLWNMGNVNGAIHKLQDFIKQLENDAKKLTSAQREQLLAKAQATLWAMEH